jgi:cytochrome c-type biogenesis protein CcsB
MDIPELVLTLVCYLAATASFVGYLLTARESLHRTGSWLLSAGFAIHAVAIGVRSFEGGYLAVKTLHEALSVLSCVIVGAYLVLQGRYRLAVIGAFVAPLAFLVTLSAALFYSGVQDLPRTLNTVWLPAHVAPALLGYAILAVAFCVSIAYLVQERQLKSKRRPGLFRRLPPLETLDHLNYRFMVWGFSLFTLAIVTGALLAKTAWGEFWSWEPVQVWSVITWLLYALLLHSRTAGWRGRRAARLTIFGFAALLVSFFSVSFVFPGKYGGHFGG